LESLTWGGGVGDIEKNLNISYLDVR
jgi:hypothetical protein